MADKITDKELKLAERVDDLSDAAARPVIGGGGLLAAAANFLMQRVSRGLMMAALTIFIAYHGWEAYNGSLQALADLQTKRAEAGTAIAEANALNAKTKAGTLALANMKAELDRLQQQAAETQAKADADNTIINDQSVKLQTIRAEIDKTKAEAQAARVEADAQLQKINGLSANVAQKKAEVETAEAEAQAEIQIHKNVVQESLKRAGGFNQYLNR
jgi:chromosome segregation ATPase